MKLRSFVIYLYSLSLSLSLSSCLGSAKCSIFDLDLNDIEVASLSQKSDLAYPRASCFTEVTTLSKNPVIRVSCIEETLYVHTAKNSSSPRTPLATWKRKHLHVLYGFRVQRFRGGSVHTLLLSLCPPFLRFRLGTHC